MKNGIILAISLASLTDFAQAQSSVTLYGRIDDGLRYLAGPHGSQVSAASGFFDGSIFGIKGYEDIGGGTGVVFDLRAGINTQNGKLVGGVLFDKTAIVGLTNKTFGTFKTGNLGTGEVQEGSFVVDPQQFQTFGLSTLVRGRNWSQAANGVEYTSPTFDGLTIKGQYDLTNSGAWNAGNPGSAPTQLGATAGLGSAQGRSDGIKAQYNGSNFELLAIYDEIRDQNGQFSNVYLASRSILAGGTVSLASFKFYGGYQHLGAPNASYLGYFGSAAPTSLPAGTSLPTAVDQEWLGVAWQASPAASLGAALYHANANNGNGNATMYTLSGQYNLSKSTYVYAELGYVDNSRTSNIGLGDGFSDPYGANSNNDPVHGGTSTAPNYGHGQFAGGVGILTQF